MKIGELIDKYVKGLGRNYKDFNSQIKVKFCKAAIGHITLDKKSEAYKLCESLYKFIAANNK